MPCSLELNSCVGQVCILCWTLERLEAVQQVLAEQVMTVCAVSIVALAGV